MTLHVEPLIYILRWYEGDGSYEARSPYDAVMIVEMIGPKKAYVCAAHGALSREFRQAVEAFMIERGIEMVETERHGRTKTYGLPE